MPAYRDISEPCLKCGGERRRTQSGALYCVDCKRKHREDNIEAYKARDKAYHLNNREASLQRMKFYNQGERTPRKAGIHINERAKIWRKQGNHGSRHPEYGIYGRMKDRCYNLNSPDYDNYGGRKKNPIKVCDRWLESFDNFITDMGSRPEPRQLYSIERLDVDGNYEPNNCVWATRKVQNNNSRRNVSYRMGIPDNETVWYQNRWVTLKEFSEVTGVHLTAVKYRYAKYPASTDWLLHAEADSRFYKYNEHFYNIAELSHISGISIPILRGRILRCNWSVKKAMETEVERRV